MSSSSIESMRILVVDDEPDVLETVEDVLADEVREVSCASSYEAACNALENGERFDAALFDLMGVRGLELLERFAERLPCLVITSHALSPEALREAISRKAVAYIPKSELVELPQYIRIAAAAPPGMNLWQVWLHPRLDLLNLRSHLGQDLEQTAPDFFDDLIYGARSAEIAGEIVEHPGGVVEVRHEDPPSNLLSAGTTLLFRRLFERLREEGSCRAVVCSSGLYPELPPDAVDRASDSAALRWLPQPLARGLARLALRIGRPRLGRSVFFGCGMPLDHVLDPALLQAFLEFSKDLFLDIFTFPKPVVFAIAGPAVSTSFELALCGHFVVGDPNAVLWLPEHKLGFTPPAAIALLINRVGVQRAFEITASARPLGAAEAARLGIIDKLVKVGKTRLNGVEIARQLAEQHGVSALQLARKRVGFDMEEALDESLEEWRRLTQLPSSRAKMDELLAAREEDEG